MLASMFVPSPENVIELEVAISPPVESVPETSALPWTDKVEPGVVVPIPTFPLELIAIPFVCPSNAPPAPPCMRRTTLSL